MSTVPAEEHVTRASPSFRCACGDDTTVYQGDLATQVPAEETLDGGNVVPAYRIRLRDVLDELNAELA